jgi:hypothetical protein
MSIGVGYKMSEGRHTSMSAITWTGNKDLLANATFRPQDIAPTSNQTSFFRLVKSSADVKDFTGG